MESVHLFPFMLPGAKGPLADMYRRLTRLMVAAGTDEQDAEARTALTVGLAKMARSDRLVGSLFILYTYLVLQSLFLSIVVIAHLVSVTTNFVCSPEQRQ